MVLKGLLGREALFLTGIFRMGRIYKIECYYVMPFTEFDRSMMQRALLLARAGVGRVSPNPLVGCVIVSENGKILGEGAHLIYGGAHAEPNAIHGAESKGHSVERATAYVTLEPHCHHGKTKPCSKLLIEKKISRCVVAMEDPYSEVRGGGIREMREAGIAVEVGLLEEEARELNKFFIKHVATGLPYITIKIASTLDGKSALSSGEPLWITSEASRTIVHQMRASYDAVLIGTHTALMDNPALTVRLTEGRQPRRLVLDARLELPPTLKLFTDEHRSKTLILTTPNALASKGHTFASTSVELLAIEGSEERIDLLQMLRQLGAAHIASILVEPGPTLAASMIQENLFDELAIFYAPTMLGDTARSCIGPLDLLTMKHAPQLSLRSAERVKGSDDMLVQYKSNDSGSV